MKRLTVIIPPVVQEQILTQVLYIARDSIDNALAWEDRLRAAIAGIGDMPGHAVDEDASDRLGYTIRKKVFEGTYLIHYRVNEESGTVGIINFRHGARLPVQDEPNAKTVEALNELERGRTKKFKNTDDFYKDIGI